MLVIVSALMCLPDCAQVLSCRHRLSDCGEDCSHRRPGGGGQAAGYVHGDRHRGPGDPRRLDPTGHILRHHQKKPVHFLLWNLPGLDHGSGHCQQVGQPAGSVCACVDVDVWACVNTCVSHVSFTMLLGQLLLELLWLIGVACSSLSAIWVKSGRARGTILYLREWTDKSGQQSQMCVSAGYHRQVHVRQIPCCKCLSLRISRHQPNWPRCILHGSAWLGLPGILHCCWNQLSFWHITEALVNMCNPINVFSNYIMTRA